MIEGYCVKAKGKLLVNTVHGHARGAMVNYLWTEKRLKITNDWTGAHISAAFKLYEHEAAVVKIQINQAPE